MEQQAASAAGGQDADRDEDQVNHVQQWRPFFHLGWAEPQRLWDELKAKEAKYQHSTAIFKQHPTLDPQKRAILLSWLSEVCEVYSLRRETYYLSLEFVDRFLLWSTSIRMSQLQLTGVTALMLASKMEEVSPPTGREFAYVTDGACDWNEVCAFELYMSEKLSWMFAPPTLNTWLQLYLQIAAVQRNHAKGTGDPISLPTHSPGPDGHSTSPWDVSALVEHTRTMDLAKTEGLKDSVCYHSCGKVAGFKDGVCCHSCGKVAGCTTDEVKESEACEGFNDSGHCEGTEESENKENEIGDENDNTAAEEEETCDKLEMCNVHGKRTVKDCVCREKTNLIDACQEKRGGGMCKETEKEAEVDRKELEDNKEGMLGSLEKTKKEAEVDRKEVEDNKEGMLGSLEKTEAVDCEEPKERPHKNWTTGLDQSSRQVEEVDANVEPEMVDAGFEDDEMDFESCEEEAEEDTNVLNALYSQHDYVKASQLMDLVALDSNSLRFKYSVLAAAVVFHCLHCEDVCQLTGLTQKEINPCIDWMKIHKMVLEKSSLGDSWGASPAPDGKESSHTIQTHFVSESVWTIAMNLSDLYFTSEHDGMTVMDRV